VFVSDYSGYVDGVDGNLNLACCCSDISTAFPLLLFGANNDYYDLDSTIV